MTSNLIKQLRRDIDAKHDEARRALDDIDRYLKAAPAARPPFIRERVLAILSDGFAAIMDIEEATGLTNKQIRGVINASDLRSRLTRKDIDGIWHYCIKE